MVGPLLAKSDLHSFRHSKITMLTEASCQSLSYLAKVILSTYKNLTYWCPKDWLRSNT